MTPPLRSTASDDAPLPAEDLALLAEQTDDVREVLGYMGFSQREMVAYIRNALGARDILRADIGASLRPADSGAAN